MKIGTDNVTSLIEEIGFEISTIEGIHFDR